MRGTAHRLGTSFPHLTHLPALNTPRTVIHTLSLSQTPYAMLLRIYAKRVPIAACNPMACPIHVSLLILLLLLFFLLFFIFCFVSPFLYDRQALIREVPRAVRGAGSRRSLPDAGRARAVPAVRHPRRRCAGRDQQRTPVSNSHQRTHTLKPPLPHLTRPPRRSSTHP